MINALFKKANKFLKEIQDIKNIHPKYVKWGLKELQKGHSVNDLLPTLRFFHNNINKFPPNLRDINAFQDLKDLENLLKEDEFKSKRQEIKSFKSGFKKLFENKDVVLGRVDSKQSCIYYGSNTKWCITQGDQEFFEEYSANNSIFYFLINKKLPKDDPLAKIAFTYVRSQKTNEVKQIQVFNSLDEKININLVENIEKYKLIMDKDVENLPPNIIYYLDKGLLSEEQADYIINLHSEEEQKQLKNFIHEKYVDKYKHLYNEQDLARLSKDKNLLKKLSKNRNPFIRKNVARNLNTPVDILIELSKETDPNVRYCLAGNPNTPADILAELSKDKDIEVRCCVAENPNTPEDILRELSKDKNIYVIYCITENPNTPEDILRELSTLEDIFIGLSKDENIRVRYNIATNINTPIDVLIELSNDESNDESNSKGFNVRYGVAANINTPENILRKLSKDENGPVRYGVAINPSTPKDVLIELSNDKVDLIRNIAIRILNRSKQMPSIPPPTHIPSFKKSNYKYLELFKISRLFNNIYN